MEAKILEDGTLVVVAQGQLERFALREWMRLARDGAVTTWYVLDDDNLRKLREKEITSDRFTYRTTPGSPPSQATLSEVEW